jgi:hypothetical protein
VVLDPCAWKPCITPTPSFVLRDVIDVFQVADTLPVELLVESHLLADDVDEIVVPEHVGLRPPLLRLDLAKFAAIVPVT